MRPKRTKQSYFLCSIASMLLSWAVSAQDNARILGGISDGSLPAPPPKPALPPVEVRETRVHQFPGQKATFNRIVNPGLPHPRPVKAEPAEWSRERSEWFWNSPYRLQWIETAAKTTRLSISATVVDNRATFLRWWHEGQEYWAWSNADWMILSGFFEWEKGDKRFHSYLSLGRLKSEDLRQDSVFRIPDNLPTEWGSYVITKGNNNPGACLGIDALHEIYRNDYSRLKKAFEAREQRKTEREIELRINPPKAEDIVLNYWKIQPKRAIDKRNGGDR